MIWLEPGLIGDLLLDWLEAWRWVYRGAERTKVPRLNCLHMTQEVTNRRHIFLIAHFILKLATRSLTLKGMDGLGQCVLSGRSKDSLVCRSLYLLFQPIAKVDLIQYILTEYVEGQSR